ncbi:hypothetical protein DCAR_0934348 [Daucus carota subsp. sativus]|uniref:Uncharacterized protein n=1 Tax=Daucus carota subsp. sativus TaxID=79200 RepID=A0A175YG00_DAUCS|nr:hypothetical protein DCAR_0934348 [Daucus carota subsp. sativus]
MGMVFVAWAFIAWVGSVLVAKKGESGGNVFVSLMGALPNLSFIAEAKAAATRLSVMITRKPEIICEIRKIILPGITFSSFLSIMNHSDQVQLEPMSSWALLRKELHGTSKYTGMFQAAKEDRIPLSPYLSYVSGAAAKPPQFVKQTIFTSFWELFYLFVVGIIVCYGLFSRRNCENKNLGCSSSDFSASYVSGISYVSSFFENGVGNTYGYGEKNVTRDRGFGESFDFDEFTDSGSSRLRKGVSDENVRKEWDSKCAVTESMVFVANGKYEVKPERRNGHRPLNLPVRSLKSRIIDIAGDHEGNNLAASDISKKLRFRGLVPINLDEKFRETVVASPVPWGLRSERMDLRENMGNVKPAFVGKTELVCPKLPTAKPLSPTILTSEMEEFERKDSFRVSFPPALESSLAPLRNKPSSSRFSSQRFGTEVAAEKNNKNNLKSFSKGETEALSNRATKGVVSSNLDSKPANLVKARSMVGSFSAMSVDNICKNDLKGLHKGQKEESMYKPNECIEFLKSDVRHADLVKGQLQVGSTSQMSNERSSDNNLKASFRTDKGDLLEGENTSNDFWNLDLNTACLLNGSFGTALSSENDGEKKSETASVDFGNPKKEDLRSRNSIDSLKPDVIPKSTMNCLKRGKSVRTIRSNELSVDVKKSEEAYLIHTGDKSVKLCDEDKAGLQKKYDWRDGLICEVEEHSRKNKNISSDMKNSKLRKNRHGERQKNGTRNSVKCESIFMESDNFQVIADKEETRPGIVGDTHIEFNEVDKKAAEFIAKFREQIRLQKVASKREMNFL